MLNETHLCTSLAWDNDDEQTETLSGKGTLNDTMGICYQNVPTELPQNVPHDITEGPSTNEQPKRKTNAWSFKMDTS